MINKIINKSYINNASDILELFQDVIFINVFNSINDEIIYINSSLIHRDNKISLKELFIFNIDMYITYIKNFINIDSLQLRYIIMLTLHNKNIKLLVSNKYYYDYIDYYNNLFTRIFMYNYKKNIKLLSKFINIEEKNFNELVFLINKHKKRVYSYFENINNKNINFYIPIISNIENIT